MKKLNILILTMIALAGLTFVAPRSWAQGVDNPAVFELDGNTANDPALAGQDWDTVTPLTPNPIQDPAPQTIFTTGGSKDVNDVSQWRWTNGSVPDKDNILQAVATALPLPNGHTAIYFAASRFANSGNADIGLWFFQQNVAPQPNGTFGPAPGQVANHTDGDLLVLVNFENGGLVPSIFVYKWQGGVNGGPVLAGNLTTGECGVGPNAGAFDACAITNATATPAPSFWNYVPKSGTPGTFPPQSFFEGGVDLNTIFGPGNVPCFSSFLTETRSSSSITATLKDFAEGSFNLCKITVVKNCEFVSVVNNGTAFQYTFSGTVHNDGAGAVYDVQVIDTPGATGTQTPANPIPVVGTDVDGDGSADDLAPGATGTWSATFVTTEIMFSNVALAQAAAVPGGVRTVTDTDSASCTGHAESSISITKACDPGASLLDIGSQLVVQVGVSGKVTNNGQARLTGITLADNPAATITLTKSTLNPGEQTTWSATYQPDAVPEVPCKFPDVIRVTAATPDIGDPVPFSTVCPDPTDLACASAACELCPSTP